MENKKREMKNEKWKIKNEKWKNEKQDWKNNFVWDKKTNDENIEKNI